MQTFILRHAPVAQTVFFGSLVFLIVLLPFDEGGNGYILQLVVQIILLGCAVFWGLQLLRRGQVDLIFDRLDWFVLGFVVWAAISVYFAAYKYAALLGLIKLLSYTALFYLARILFPFREKRAVLLAAILSSSLLQLVVAFYAFSSGHAPILQAGFVNPNELACFFVIGIAIALSYLFFHRPEAAAPNVRSHRFSDLKGPTAKAVTTNLWAAVAFGGLLIGLLALKSRGAAIGFVCTGLFLTTLRNKRCGLIFLLSVGLLGVLPLSGGSMLQRLRKQDDPFAYQRLDIWQSTVKMIADHPVSGVGLGMYAYYGPTYNFPVEHLLARYGKRLDLAHSDFLQIGAETGLIGLILFVGGLVQLSIYGVRQLKQPPLSWQTAAATAGILGVLAQGLFSNLLASPAIAIITIILGIMLMDGAGKYRHIHRSFSTDLRSAWQWYCALGLLGLYLAVPVIGYPFLGHRAYLQYQQLLKMKNYPQAVAHLQTALQFAPMQAYYHQALGNLYLAAFRNQPNLDAFYEGYQALTQAIRSNPLEADFYLSLAELHREMFHKMLPTMPTAQNAVREYQRAIQANPFNPFIRFALATLYADLNEFEPALATLRAAITLEPHFVGGYQMLGKLLTHLQRSQEAGEAFQQAEAILKQYQAGESDSDYVKSLLRPLK